VARFALGIAIVAALFGAGCGDVAVPDHPDPLDHRADQSARDELRLVTTDAKFAPAKLTARTGVTTVLTLENNDDIEHDFQIDDIDVELMDWGDNEDPHDGGHSADGDISVHAGSGQSDSITFVVNEPGMYEFYCTIAGHKESGMAGTLHVE